MTTLRLSAPRPLFSGPSDVPCLVSQPPHFRGSNQGRLFRSLFSLIFSGRVSAGSFRRGPQGRHHNLSICAHVHIVKRWTLLNACRHVHITVKWIVAGSLLRSYGAATYYVDMLTEPMSKKSEAYIAPSREGKVNLAVWTSPERRQRLKVAAALSDQSLVEIIERAIDRELDRMEKGRK